MILPHLAKANWPTGEILTQTGPVKSSLSEIWHMWQLNIEIEFLELHNIIHNFYGGFHIVPLLLGVMSLCNVFPLTIGWT